LASATFLADIAQNVAGDRVQVDSLLPVGVDPHAYQASPSDVAKVTESTVLIINGLEYEHFLESLLENVGGERLVIEASAGLSPAEDAASEHGVDPHMWLDPNLVITYAENIRDGLASADPEGKSIYEANTEAYISQLQELDAQITEQVSQIPADKRLLVTNHEALGYFADRYGFTIIGAVVPSVSSDAAPSAQQMAQLVEQIKTSGARAVFLNETDNPVLATQIAQETGVKVVDDLYVESLNENAPTYIDMMKHNVTRIVEALK
jgi:ABC-type Zn uptake system ZnuABC Zn-binding protein ZnuA